MASSAVLTPRPFGSAVRAARRLRGMKQMHLADMLGVAQSSVSRIEAGEIVPTDGLQARLLEFLAARLDPARDAALKRLVQGAADPVHLVCDLTHRLLAASPAREREWRRSAAELAGRSLWAFATPEIRSAEASLPGIGWGARDGTHSLRFTCGANKSRQVRIVPATLLWDHVLLSDGAPARLVTGIPRRQVEPISPDA